MSSFSSASNTSSRGACFQGPAALPEKRRSIFSKRRSIFSKRRSFFSKSAAFFQSPSGFWKKGGAHVKKRHQKVWCSPLFKLPLHPQTKGCPRLWAEMIPSKPDSDNTDVGMESTKSIQDPLYIIY
jgi:hypothetical protein